MRDRRRPRPMNLPKVVLVLALVYCAAVLIPLRRAQRFFATPSATLSLSNTPRPSLRRRATGPRVVIRKDTGPRSADAASRDATTPAIPRRRLAAPSGERHAVEKQLSRQSISATERSDGAFAHADCDRIVERDAVDLRPRVLNPSARVDRLAVTTQAVADLAAPPPRHA